jgi:hypothetical protein
MVVAGSAPSNAGTTHSHEVFVCGAAPHVLGSTDLVLHSFKPTSMAHARIAHRPPLDLGLGSIFRPPIA